MAVWPGPDDISASRGAHSELPGCRRGVGYGSVRGLASSPGGGDAGDVRPDDLQGLPVSPVQAGRGAVVLVVTGCAVEGLHRLREGEDGADRGERPAIGPGGGPAG